MTHVILLALAPIFFVMALGYWAGRTGRVDNRQVGSLNLLTMSFALPASLFSAMASAPRSEIIQQSWLFLILGMTMLLVYAAWYLASRLLLKAGPGDAAMQALTIAFPNLAGVGLPIASAVLGATGMVQVAVVLAAGSILVTPLSLVIVELNAGGVSPLSLPRRVFKALFIALTIPVVLAPVLGILSALVGFQLGDIAQASLLLIGHAAAGVALFLTGLVLSSQSFRLDWKVVAATVMADVMRPLFAAGFVIALSIPWDLAKVAILLATVPSGFFGILFAVNYKLDSGSPGSMVIASTIFSIITMSSVIWLLFPA